MMRELKQNKDGAAMVAAIIITMILVFLGMTMLLTTYSLFGTVNKQGSSAQCHELALTVSETLGQQIETGDYASLSVDTFYQKLISGGNQVSTNHPLWYYLRCHLLHDDDTDGWKYYDESGKDAARSSAVTWKSFDASFFGADSSRKMPAYKTTITMYWTVADPDDAGGSGDPVLPNEGLDKLKLTVMVDCSNGKENSVVTSVYNLDVRTFTEAPAGAGSIPAVWEDSVYGQEIFCQENWIFMLDTRR